MSINVVSGLEPSSSSSSSTLSSSGFSSSSKKRELSISNFDLDEILKIPCHINKTQNNYDRCIIKFYAFLERDISDMCKGDFTDENIATYFYALGKFNEWKPHFKKNSNSSF